MYNTIILRHGYGEINEKGDTIFGIDSDAEEVARWSIDDKDAAMQELAKHKCSYRTSRSFHGRELLTADEWALEYCEYDLEGGEYLMGSDYDLAEEDE